MLDATLTRPYVHTGPITYSTPEVMPGTKSVQQCKVYAGPHHVANVVKSGPAYRVMGLYYGAETARTEKRSEVPNLARLIGARTPWNPKDCTLDCKH